MIHPIPSGTRDVLPEEMRELRAISEAMREVFAAAGYGELYTPALELEQTLTLGDAEAARPAYRLFDESGNVLVLRSDMTIPIARVVATRYADAEPPLRFSYLSRAYRRVRPHRGEAREQLQAGIELVGAATPEGTAEAITVLCRTLDAVGLTRYRVGVGSAAVYPALLERAGIPEERRRRLLGALVRRDFVALELEAEGLPAEVVEVPQLRGGPGVLEAAGEGASNLRRVHALLEPEVAERVIYDLGLVRELGYYTGAIFEVYDEALGVPLGGGGRYDELLGRFGRPLPAVGWALEVERVHEARRAA